MALLFILLPLSARGESEQDDEHHALHRRVGLTELLSWDWKQQRWIKVPKEDRDLSAQILLVHLWAPSCRPCMEEFRGLLSLTMAQERQWPEVRVLLVLETQELGPEAQQREMLDFIKRLCQQEDMRELCRARPVLPGRWLLDAGESIKKEVDQNKLPVTLIMDARRMVREAYVGSLLGRLGQLQDSVNRLRQPEGGQR